MNSLSPREIVDTIILPHEGGIYTDDPDDTGGPTKWGVTIPILALWLHRRCTADDIQRLEREDAVLLYCDLFVAPYGDLNGTLRVNVIDMAVNAGHGRAVRLLQQLVGVKVDGRMGPLTVQATRARDWNPLYVGMRIAHYEAVITRRSEAMKYRRGWHLRALSFLSEGQFRLRARDDQPIFGFMGKAA